MQACTESQYENIRSKIFYNKYNKYNKLLNVSTFYWVILNNFTNSVKQFNGGRIKFDLYKQPINSDEYVNFNSNPQDCV